MIENIIAYQIEYFEIINEFKKNENTYDDYLLLLDKVELLLKRNKKTITNFLELNNSDYLYYGGATYFDNCSMEINPVTFSGKKIIISEPLLKLSPFLKLNDFFDFDRMKEILDSAIDNTLKLKDKLLDATVIYINPNDYILEIKENIYKTARDITIQYINENLEINYNDVDDFVHDNNVLSFEELDEKYPKLNNILFTVDSTPKMSLKEKIIQGYIDCGIDKEKIKDVSAIEQVIFTFIGLFGQAFELKTISIILKCPLYITRPNVILYLNCFIYVDEEDKKRILESNVLFALYQVLKRKNPEQVQYNSDYKKIVESLSKKCNSIDDYVNELKKIVN